MLGFQQQINLQTDSKSGEIHVNYDARNKRTIFDICDVCGRIIKTGTLKAKHTAISISDLEPSAYIFLILDGDRAISKKFTVTAQA